MEEEKVQHKTSLLMVQCGCGNMIIDIPVYKGKAELIVNAEDWFLRCSKCRLWLKLIEGGKFIATGQRLESVKVSARTKINEVG